MSSDVVIEQDSFQTCSVPKSYNLNQDYQKSKQELAECGCPAPSHSTSIPVSHEESNQHLPGG